MRRVQSPRDHARGRLCRVPMRERIHARFGRLGGESAVLQSQPFNPAPVTASAPRAPQTLSRPRSDSMAPSDISQRPARPLTAFG
jgi:hypothetical protein